MKTLKVDKLSLNKIIPKLKINLSFQVDAGQCLGISGESGLGKSMLLKAIADIIEYEGVVSLDGVQSDAIAANLWRQQVMLVPAESFWWFETVAPHFDAPDMQLFKFMGFSADILERQIHFLSSGEKQRLSLLRALQYQPQVLLVDEPTANLDKQSQAKIEELLLQFLASKERALIWVSHDLEQLKRVSNRYLKLHHGSYEEILWK